MKKILLLSILTLMFSCGKNENEKAIKGLQPVDIYLNLEKQGFTTNKTLGGDLKMWESKKSNLGEDFIVETNSSDTKSVEFVRATVITNSKGDLNKNILFFKFIASLPYEGSDHVTSTKWLEKNLTSKEADTIINEVKFTLKNPSKMVRTLQLEKE
ncbi:hypothetical protein HX004_14115 [Myroides sp. 1354]|uniref:hypothetical protein n=1 Tax=unclassified Myroides TaxID=2642485 RepID=UPI0025769162|nr:MULTISPECIES: hypothetical protein [unclassified Myroides]MDM1045890.1 hypothetical protein [Myroides sp. R163-1]MDM1056900.1 hypothetical protein [Myroides sp. 1354]MDM1070095.1 hypothetical protein [Myroides sp. 1372]